MSLTRTHIAFLGIISVFTGLIGPGTLSDGVFLSYLMTNIRWITYVILIALIVSFILASARNWFLYKLSVGIIIFGLLTLLFLTFFGNVTNMRTGESIAGLSWGWIFLLVGGILLLISYRSNETTYDETRFSDTVDTIIGMVGGFALACIAGILIFSSLSFFSRGQSHDILKRMYVSGEIVSLSGNIRSAGSFMKMPRFTYNRGKDQLLTYVDSESGSIWKFVSEGTTSTGTMKRGITPLLIGKGLYGIDENMYAYSGGRLLLGSRISQGGTSIVYKDDGAIHIIHDEGIDVISHKGLIGSPVVLSEDRSTLIWTDGQMGKKRILKNGEQLGEFYTKIHTISTSRTGKSIMALVSTGGNMIIVKNGEYHASFPNEGLSGSYISNGVNSAFITKDSHGIKKVVFNTEVVSRDLEEIRELFLEEEGGSYAYFGKPIGEDSYCLFTRYKGNLCGLEGYMNPVLGADGGSIVFAGKKDNAWHVYRNTDILVNTTGYDTKDVTYDYFFVDKTNPRAFLFIEKNPINGTYSYRKNGVLLPGTWKDISTEVEFGYDNHILTAAEDSSGWRMLEL